MLKIAQLCLLLALAFGFVESAKAELHIEPVWGYNLQGKAELPSGKKIDDKSSFAGTGMAYGGRLGFTKFGFQVGLDYLHSTLDMDLEEDVLMDEWAGFVGFEFPILFRIYAGYIFSATATTENKAGDNIEFSKGSGAKVGLGFTPIPLIDINLEYRAGRFGMYEIDSATKVEVEEDTNYRALFLGISLPFAL